MGNMGRFLFVGVCLVFGTHSIRAQSLELVLRQVPSGFQANEQRVTKILSKYREQESAIRADLRTQLANLKRSVLQSAGEVIGNRKLTQISALENWLKEGGDIPKCDELFPLVVTYAKEISAARSGLGVQTSKLVKQLDRAGYIALTQKIRTAYEDLGGVLDGDRALSNGAVFVGFRKHVNAADPMPVKMTFQKVAMGQVVGRVEKSWMYRGHPIHEMTGRLDGAVLSIQTGKTLALGNKSDGLWRYDAYVIGRTIIGEFKGYGKKRKLSGGYFRLDKRG